MTNHNHTSEAAERVRQETVPATHCERRKVNIRRFPAKGWVPAQLIASGFGRVARRCPARGWVLAEQPCIARGSAVRDGDGDGDCHGDGDGDEPE